MTSSIVLTARQREELLKVLGCFAPRVERVDVYGSRARGDARPGSDVDLMLAGDIDQGVLSRIGAALEDSYLSIFADANAYALLEPGPFADEVAREAVTLFTAEELASAPPFTPAEGIREWYRPSFPPAGEAGSPI